MNISIIIPCRNEEKFIGKCLESILTQDYLYPHPIPPPQVGREKERGGDIEVLVIDGMSEDGTRKNIEKYIKQHSFIKLLDNPKKITPCALNIGIKNAKGKIILWMSAHNRYEKDYVSKCVKYLNEYNADNVGGIMVTLPRNETFIGKAIATVLSSPFGVGNSAFRTGTKEPKWVDTVFGGCYRREVFDKIGLFNENLPRGQDMEFNLRLKKAGGKTLLVPEIVSYYYALSDLRSFCRHNFINGVWAILPFKFSKIMPVSLRHLVPFFFVLSLLGTGILSFFFLSFLRFFLLIVGSYTLANLYFSLKIALRKKNIKYLFMMPILFAALHLGYGFGSICGAIKLFLPAKKRK